MSIQLTELKVLESGVLTVIYLAWILSASYSEQMWYDLSGAEYIRLATSI